MIPSLGPDTDHTMSASIRKLITGELKKHTLAEPSSGRVRCSCGVVCLQKAAADHVASAVEKVLEDSYIKRPRCHYCDKPARSRDHIVPEFAGGVDASFNVVPACIDCNGDKAWKITTCSCTKCAESVAWHIDNILLSRPRNLHESLQQTRFRRLIESTIETQRKGKKDGGRTHQVPSGDSSSTAGSDQVEHRDGVLPEEVAETS